jgi:hypothetical protein
MMRGVDKDWTDGKIRANICKREMHEFRKAQGVIPDEDKKDKKDY